MRGIWDVLPPVTRWLLVGAGALLLALVIGAGVWSLLERREATAARALASATLNYREAVSSRQEAQLAALTVALEQFLRDYPRSGPAAEGWFLLGNVEYARGRFEPAVHAYGQALGRASGSLAALSQIGVAYAWESKGDLDRAHQAYVEALKGRGPRDFLYGEALLGKARAEEQLKRPEAVETYRKFLADVPESALVETVRVRLATLGAQP